jgi:hypothetical protein
VVLGSGEPARCSTRSSEGFQSPSGLRKS